MSIASCVPSASESESKFSSTLVLVSPSFTFGASFTFSMVMFTVCGVLALTAPSSSSLAVIPHGSVAMTVTSHEFAVVMHWPSSPAVASKFSFFLTVIWPVALSMANIVTVISHWLLLSEL